MIVSTHTVLCNGCGLSGPSSDVSPGLARAAAKTDDWTTQPGPRHPIDLCPPCTTAAKETN